MHDILKQIYAYCEDRDLSKCAQTCKNWTDPALDHVWYELRAKDFVHLFAILAPLQPAQTQSSAMMRRMVFALSSVTSSVHAERQTDVVLGVLAKNIPARLEAVSATFVKGQANQQFHVLGKF